VRLATPAQREQRHHLDVAALLGEVATSKLDVTFAHDAQRTYGLRGEQTLCLDELVHLFGVARRLGAQLRLVLRARRALHVDDEVWFVSTPPTPNFVQRNTALRPRHGLSTVSVSVTTRATSIKDWYHDTVGVFCSRFAPIASLLAVACGDPLFASFGVGEHDDSAKKSDAASEGKRDAEPAARDHDAATGTRGSTGLTPEGCYVLPDLSLFSVVDAGVVIAREAARQGCDPPDGGGTASAGTTYMRSDGLPMVKAGARYSFRWTSDTFVTRVRLLGGNESCATEPILFMEPGTATQGLSVVTCSEFTAAKSAQYLRLYGYGYDFAGQLLNANGAFSLCPDSCPPNTKLLVDAGTTKTKVAETGAAP
jgi:hypothetical protein